MDIDAIEAVRLERLRDDADELYTDLRIDPDNPADAEARDALRGLIDWLDEQLDL